MTNQLKTLAVLLSWLFAVGLYAQNITIKGNVTDNVFKEPVIGATIVIQGTSNGTVTDYDGNYTLSDVPENAKLEFSYVGMKTQVVNVAGKLR